MKNRDVIEAELLLFGSCLVIGTVVYITRVIVTAQPFPEMLDFGKNLIIYGTSLFIAMHALGLYVYYTKRDFVESFR